MTTEIYPHFRAAPGPKGYPILGNILDMRKDPLEFFSRASEDYGDYVRVQMGPVNVLLITNPKDIKYVLQENGKNYSKEGYIFDQVRTFLGRGLIFNEGGAFWRRQRKLTQPAFHIESLKGFIDQFNHSSELMIERWKVSESSGVKINILPEMMKTTLQVIGQTLLSRDLMNDADGVGESLSILLHEIDRRSRLLTPISNYLPTRSNLRVRHADQALQALVYKIIQDRKRLGNSGNRDLLAMYMSAIDEDTGSGMTDEQVKDEVMSIFIAGHETTANALTWLWYLLSQNPEAELKIRSEVDEVLKGRPPELGDFAQLKYTEMAFLEALRLYPPVWILIRSSIESDQIGSYKVPSGTPVFMSPYITQRHSKYWPDPLTFKPERFAGEGASRTSKFDFFAFAGGPRVCIGQRFAMMEAITIIARVMQNFELKRSASTLVKPGSAVTLRPSSPIYFHLKSRIPCTIKPRDSMKIFATGV